MRLVSFTVPETPNVADAHTGVVVDNEVVDLSHDPVGLPGDMVALLDLGSDGLAAAAAAVSVGRRFELAEVTLLAPVPRPPTVLGIGMNYHRHVAEMGREVPEYQYWFNKQRTCVVGPDAPIVVPSVSHEVDYEGELALVIGRRCKNVPAERAAEVVAGVMILNDVSVRDWQWRTPTFTMGKSFDSHAPCGPCLVTLDEVGDPGNLRLRTWVNDELRQDSSTADMIFGWAEQIAYLTSAFPLEPGDVLSTGTPAGVGAGFDPPRWLRAGDVCRIEIEGIGSLANPVADEGPITPEGLD